MNTLSSRALIVIPARYASTRLPAKPLALLGDAPMFAWVYQSAKKAFLGTARVVVATDDNRIETEAKRLSIPVVMTSPDLQSGTDRLLAVAEKVDAEFYVNVQGDEPFMETNVIEKTLSLLAEKKFDVTSAMTELESFDELNQVSVVKVLTDFEGKAIYFSRFAIPYTRVSASMPFVCKKHLGIYAYRRDALFRFGKLPPHPIEKSESLEQLRALANGMTIGLVQVHSISNGIDTPDDLERARKIIKEKGMRYGD